MLLQYMISIDPIDTQKKETGTFLCIIVSPSSLQFYFDFIATIIGQLEGKLDRYNDANTHDVLFRRDCIMEELEIKSCLVPRILKRSTGLKRPVGQEYQVRALSKEHQEGIEPRSDRGQTHKNSSDGSRDSIHRSIIQLSRRANFRDSGKSTRRGVKKEANRGF